MVSIKVDFGLIRKHKTSRDEIIIMYSSDKVDSTRKATKTTVLTFAFWAMGKAADKFEYVIILAHTSTSNQSCLISHPRADL